MTTVDHCELTGFLGWMLQAVLAGLAFTCLIGMIIIYLLYEYDICINQFFLLVGYFSQLLSIDDIK